MIGLMQSKHRVVMRSERYGEFDLDKLVDSLCHSHAPAPNEQDLYNAQVAILTLARMMRDCAADSDLVVVAAVPVRVEVNASLPPGHVEIRGRDGSRVIRLGKSTRGSHG